MNRPQKNSVQRAPKSLFSKKRTAVKSGKQKRTVKHRNSVPRSHTLTPQTCSIKTRSCTPLSQTPAASSSITVIKSRLKSIPSDVQLNATAQKLQAQATLIKRLMQEKLQRINKETVASKTIEELKLEKKALDIKSFVAHDKLKAVEEEH